MSRTRAIWPACSTSIFAGLQGDVDVAGHCPAHPGQRRRGAVARQGHRRRRDDRQGRPGALQGQGTRQERLAAVRSGDGRRVPQPPADEGRSAQPPSRRGPARRLPADRRDGHDAHRQLRGALPLGPSASSAPISPAVFIPLAEEMGIISEISAFVLEAACAECVKWPEQISVSVNLSAKDFRNRDVVEKVRACARVDRAGAAPPRNRGHRDRAARRQVADPRSISRN